MLVVGGGCAVALLLEAPPPAAALLEEARPPVAAAAAARLLPRAAPASRDGLGWVEGSKLPDVVAAAGCPRAAAREAAGGWVAAGSVVVVAAGAKSIRGTALRLQRYLGLIASAVRSAHAAHLAATFTMHGQQVQSGAGTSAATCMA